MNMGVSPAILVAQAPAAVCEGQAILTMVLLTEPATAGIARRPRGLLVLFLDT